MMSSTFVCLCVFAKRYVPKAVEDGKVCRCGAEVSTCGDSCDFCSSALHKHAERSVLSGVVVDELEAILCPSTESMRGRERKSK